MVPPSTDSVDTEPAGVAGAAGIDPDLGRQIVHVVFELLWGRDERFRQLLLAENPRRLEQERTFRSRGKSCRFYTALCRTIALEVLEGTLSPELVEYVHEKVQHAGSAVRG